jgi:hypothetical protein
MLSRLQGALDPTGLPEAADLTDHIKCMHNSKMLLSVELSLKLVYYIA